MVTSMPRGPPENGEPMSHESIEIRLRRLERRNRLLAIAWLAVIPAVAAGMAAGGGPADVVTTRRVHIVDDDDRVRVALGIDSDGSAGVFLKDAGGRVRGTLIHDDGQTVLYLLDDEGTIRVGAARFAHGGGGFALHGAQSKGAAVLYHAGDKGSLTFYDPAGAIVERVPATTPDKGAQP